MKQEAHAWIAIRAVDLLDSDPQTKELAKLLKPHVHKAAIGAWLPDLNDAKLGGSQVANHCFKLEPYTSTYIPDRFVVSKADMRKKLKTCRLTRKFIDDWGDSVLDAAWWSAPYKATPPPGKHIANRAMSISVALIDLLLFGDDAVAAHVPRDIDFATDLVAEERSTEEMVALWLFYLSHFVADAVMPCHCDARRLSSYTNGRLHRKLEEHWSGLVSSDFSDDNILSGNYSSQDCLQAARNVDGVVGLSFPSSIPKFKEKDVWTELVNVCRGSFAIASIIAPPDSYPYDGQHRPSYDDLFAGANGQQLLDDVDRTCLHDAVLNVAMVWKHIWRKF